MNEQLLKLIELQKLDTAIIERARLVESIPTRLATGDKEYNLAKKALDTEEKKLEEIEKRKRSREKEVAELGEKITKLQGRTNDVKTNREYQAVLTEIEGYQQEIDAIEEKILILMDEIDEQQKKLEDARAIVREEEKKNEGEHRELEKKAEQEHQALEELRKKRTDLLKGIDPPLYDRYMKLLESARGLAVVEARNEVCQGCHMNMPPQFYVELKKTGEIYHCPQCRRILYHLPEKEQAEAEEAATE